MQNIFDGKKIKYIIENYSHPNNFKCLDLECKHNISARCNMKEILVDENGICQDVIKRKGEK